MKGVKLTMGNQVRVVAPSHSLAIISGDVRTRALERLRGLGLNITFGKHVEECNQYLTSAIASRIEDLHDAFADSEVQAIMTVIGGYAANQLLPYLNWDLIRSNPKPIIGYSDTTVLQNALYTKAGIVSYSGPAFSTFGQEKHFDYTLQSFKQCVMDGEPFSLLPSDVWTDDQWYLDQENRHPYLNEGWFALGKGVATGTLLGGNLNSLRLLQGTEYFPTFENSILFLEDDELVSPSIFDRELESLMQLESFSEVRAIVLGRFQKKSDINSEMLIEIMHSKRGLTNIPIIGNVDFGHTSPICTYPIGGTVTVSADEKSIRFS